MEIKIYETEHMSLDNTILADINRYNDVLLWIKDIVNRKTAFYPTDCSIKANGVQYTIIRGDVIADNIEKTIASIARLPKRMRTIPNDTMSIKSDTFEHELWFNLDGK